MFHAILTHFECFTFWPIKGHSLNATESSFCPLQTYLLPLRDPAQVSEGIICASTVEISASKTVYIVFRLTTFNSHVLLIVHMYFLPLNFLPFRSDIWRVGSPEAYQS